MLQNKVINPTEQSAIAMLCQEKCLSVLFFSFLALVNYSLLSDCTFDISLPSACASVCKSKLKPSL